MQQDEPRPKTNFEFCDKEIKTFKEDLLCKQDNVHESMVDNPLGFIVFYVLAILFIGFLFQLSQKDFKKKEKKNKYSKYINIYFILHSFFVSFCSIKYCATF